MSIEFSEKDDEYDGGKIKLIKLWINKSRFVDHDEGWENLLARSSVRMTSTVSYVRG
jgi:hypothetical protein